MSGFMTDQELVELNAKRCMAIQLKAFRLGVDVCPTCQTTGRYDCPSCGVPGPWTKWPSELQK